MSYIKLLSPHGKSVDMAKWVVENKAPLLETDEYRNHVTMQQWIAASQQILNEHYDSMTSAGGCAQ